MKQYKDEGSFFSRQKERLSNLAKKGILVSFIYNFIVALSNVFSKSVIGKLFTSYDSTALGSSYSSGLIKKHTSNTNFFKVSKRFISKAIEGSYLLNALHGLVKRIFATTLRVHGVLLFSLGMYSFAIYILKYYTVSMITPSFASLFFSIVAMAVGIAFQTSDKPLGEAVIQSRLLSYMLFDVLELSDDLFKNDGKIYSSSSFSFLIGMVAGICTFVVPIEYAVYSLVSVIFIALVMNKPEIGLLTEFLFLPFVDLNTSFAITLLTLVSFFIKLLRGKRVIKFGFFDFTVLAFGICFFFGTAFSPVADDSFDFALKVLCFIFAYFPAKNLLRSSKLVKRSLNALTISFSAVSTVYILQSIFKNTPFSGLLSELPFIHLFDGNTLSIYFLLILPLSICSIKYAKHTYTKNFIIVFSILGIASLIFAGAPIIAVIFILSIVFLSLFFERRYIIPIVVVFLALLLIVAILPADVSAKLLPFIDIRDSFSQQQLDLVSKSAEMLDRIFPIGIGLSAFEGYSHAYGITAPDAGNLYLHFLICIGLFSLVAFIALIIVFIMLNLTYYKSQPSQSDKMISVALLLGIASLALLGNFTYIFADFRIFLAFFMLIGLCTAHIKAAKNEKPADSLFRELDYLTDTKHTENPDYELRFENTEPEIPTKEEQQ